MYFNKLNLVNLGVAHKIANLLAVTILESNMYNFVNNVHHLSTNYSHDQNITKLNTVHLITKYKL